MESSVNRVLGTYELLERIILQLGCPEEILQAQRVGRRWRAIIRDSFPLQQACWYKPLDRGICEQRNGQETFKLNPVFKRLGITIPANPWLGIRVSRSQITALQIKAQEHGVFDLEERIYDKPGSWTTMLATHPPCKRIMVLCVGNEPGDDEIKYFIESMSTYLLLGDVMAILAECQNRQEHGVDRDAGYMHYTGQFRPFTEKEWSMEENSLYGDNWYTHLKKMPDNVSIKLLSYSLRALNIPHSHFDVLIHTRSIVNVLSMVVAFSMSL